MRRIVFSIVFSLFGFSLPTVQVFSQQNETKIEVKDHKKIPIARIGVVNVEQVLRNSLVWQDLENRVEQRRAKVQKDITKEQQALESEGNRLKALQESLSQEEFSKKREVYFDKVQALQQRTEKAKTDLDNYYLVGREQVYKTLDTILEEIAKRYELSLVLDTSFQGIIHVHEKIVLDDEILTILNDRITRIQE